MAKYLLRQKARNMREKGISVISIAKELGISKGSVSIWVRDIVLSTEQLEKLRQSSLEGAEKGRLKSALFQKERRIKKLEEHKVIGRAQIGSLTEKEFFIAGLALYWAEGSKKQRKVHFCNSDPLMIKFLLLWLASCFNIKSSDIRCRVGINEIHKHRESIVKKYWSETTSIPLDQFRSTSFKKIINKKVYENFENHFGTLDIEVKQPSRFYGKIIGLIHGLSEAKVAQW